MKRWLLHIWMIGILGMLAASCSQVIDDPISNGDCEEEIEEKVQVMFTIALDNPSVGSRATWGDNYDTNVINNYESSIGNNFDNNINPDQFFVTLTLNGTTYDVQNIAHWQTANPNVYEFVGEVDVDIAATTQYTNAKIMVYANMNPNSEIFTTNYTTNQNGVAYIPMWGVHTQTISLAPGVRYVLTEPIYLLRAMAKVEVIMANNEFEIEDIRLNGYNTMGYNLPTGWNAATTAKTTDLDLEGVFRPISTYISSNENFVESTTQSGYQCYTIYVPEYRNISNTQATATPATITVTVGGEEYDIEFKKYTDGAATNEVYNIVRNHIYRFNITAVEDGIEATLKVIVKDWDTDEETWNYKDQASVEGEGKMNWEDVKENENDNNYMVAVEGTNVFVPIATKDKPAICNFRISTPVGATWHATFETVEGVYGAFMFLDAKGNEVTSVSGKVGEPAQLKIITTNTAPTDRSSAILRIAVRTSDGRTIIVKQLVPNSDDAEYTLVQSIQ